jgi:hypothetical protein
MYTGHHWLYLNIAEQNLNSFTPAWAAYRGMLATPNIALTREARQTHLGLTPHLVRLFRNADVVALEKELALETVRRSRYPNATSRLSCIYCWPDGATARLASKFWSQQGKHFDERYLVEIGVSGLKPPTIVDTRWIDRYVILSNETLGEIGVDWIDKYWSGTRYPWNGETNIPKEPLLECLVEGSATIWGTDLRMEAFTLVGKLAPDSLGILEKGRLGVDLCTRFDGTDEWRLGQTVPVLMTDNERKVLWVRNLLCLDEKLAASINHKVSNAAIGANEINWQALRQFEKDTVTLPDLRPLEVNLTWLSRHPSVLQQINYILTAFFIESGGDIETVHKAPNL